MAPTAAVQEKPGPVSPTTQTQLIKELIDQLKEACRRSLFEEIVQQQKNDLTQAIPPLQLSADRRKAKRFKPNPKKSWQELLAEAATLAPTMTEKEFGIVSRISAILLLGFLIPSSTGNNFFLNARRSRTTGEQTQSAGSRSSETPERNDMNVFIYMPLEERLEQASRFYTQGEFGEVNGCVNPARERAFRSFLKDGIGLFLSARPAHCVETDLLHILAMAISPQPQEAFISETVKFLLEKDSSSWARTKQLMACIHPRSFHVNYSHRLELVKLIADKLVLPQSSAVAGTLVSNDVLEDGAVPHLRAALHSFAASSECEAHSHEARRALVSVAVQTGDETAVREEWNALLKLVVNDCTDEVNCGDGADLTRTRCNLMEQFVLNYNEARHYADSVFTDKALDSLSTCIQKSFDKSPSVLASLLMTARSLYYFILPATANVGENNDDKRASDSLIRSAIQLLHYPSVGVSKAASSLLALAFAYNPGELTMAWVEGVEKSMEMALDANGDSADERLGAFQDVAITLSRLVPSFASNMLDLMVKRQQGELPIAGAWRMMASIATARPFAALKHVESIVSLAKGCKDDICRSQFVATLFTLRQAHLFAKDVLENVRETATKLLEDITDEWVQYKLACHALVTGNDHFAMTSFQSLLSSSSSEASFLWLSVLSNVAKAENELAIKGSDGLLTATPTLYSALSYLESHMGDSSGNEFGFQVECLRLRIDFLEQCTSLHSLCRDIRLSGNVPKATTRTGLHLCNTIKLFYLLAGRYYSLYKRSGLFLCQQSRTALRTCHAVCRWLGNAGRTTFPEMKMGKIDGNNTWPHGDQLLPLSLLLKKLDKVVLESMDGEPDPRHRAVAIAETIDAILKTPYPLPRDFTTVQSIEPVTLYLSMDRDESDDSKSDGCGLDGGIDVYPGATCVFVASGEVPSATIRKAKLPFSQVLLWHANRYVGFLNKDDEALSDGEGLQRDSSYPPGEEESSNTLATPLLPSGRYLAQIQYQAPAKEGVYSVDVLLGCRDVRGEEWELPVQRQCITVRVKI